MNYTKNFLLVLLIIVVNLILTNQLKSQGVKIEKTEKTKKHLFEVGFNVDLNTSSSIYDVNSNEKVKDTVYYNSEENEAEEAKAYLYTTDMSQQVYTLNFAFNKPFSDNFGTYFNIKFPFIHTSIEEKFEYDISDFSHRYTRNKDNYFCLSGAALEMRLAEFDFKEISVNFFASIFVPFYKYKSISDSTAEIIDNKTIELGRNFESSYGANIKLNFSSVSLGLLGKYESRTGDFTDRILTNFHFGFSNVSNTELYLNLDYVASLGEYRPEYKVSQWRSLLWERYFDLGVGFNIFFTDYFFTDIAYNIRFWGENTILRNTIKINLKYLFNF